jgi:N-acetylglucosaminyl-diphospho-decaprenol L-rhamnosyltransferase
VRVQTPPSQPDITICILSWNAKGYLERCLDSLIHPEEPDVQEALERAGLADEQEPGEQVAIDLLVVDNGSIDYSADMVETRYPEARLIRTHQNFGFAKGNNIGIRTSDARYVLLLNSDTVVPRGAITKLVRFADSTPDAAFVGPKVLNPDGSLQYSCRHFPNWRAALLRNTPLARFARHSAAVRDYLMTDWAHDEPREVDWLSGCCLLARREALGAIGLLDESFFMYCEDMDWCYRAKAAGWKSVYFPDAKIVHEVGKSSDKLPRRMIAYHHLSMYKFYRKHDGARAAWPVRMAVAGGLAVRAATTILSTHLMRLRARWQR